ncbi:AP-1 complex subunit beta-1 [Pitangus sulphuratus]|nr:AP-1 complex subunit beta-1 [Pitangus sulphuratus]
MADAKYFTTNKKGEIFELKAELNNEKKEKRKEAVKKVIAAMTVGKDVSSLFPDVVNCMQTDNLELKKLVYLYLMNYAKSQPDMAIMAVNSFVKDCEDPNPLIRALAVRTMGCIRVDKITEYLCEPLRKCLKDEDPYVRKTAAVCVAKLHDINAQMVEDQGFLDSLRDLIADSNPMVVANAVAALSEISESHPNSNLLDLNPQNINKLLTALNECTEWGQIFILDCLSNYNPKDDREAQSICERVTPRLSHANSAVVLSAVKVLMKFLELLPKDSDYYNMLLKKLAPPLVTLLSGEPEVQYVALRNINLIVQKRPEILKQEIKVFFVKYNDPIYVKLEKLDIMIRLASQANIAQVLAELKEYATEVDVDFVRKAVRAIGRCAIKQSAERCVSTLLDLIQTKVNYVVQEAIVVIRDIFRKYPNKYESIIATLCENLDSLDEPDARAAMIWIVGEYAERIDNADELLESFLEGFHDESTQVQLTLLTAIVKLFLKKPSETQELVQQVLSLATQDSDNPDLRDRGYIYWRLLSTDPVTAKEVVLSEKPLISEETDLIEPTLLDELICHIGSLASVYHKPPNAFVEGSHGIHRKHLPIHHGSTDAGDSPVGTTATTNLEQPQVIPSQGDLLGDLLNLDLGPPVNVPQVSSMQMGAVDLLGGGLDSLLGSDLGGGIGGSPAVGQTYIPSSVPATFAPSPTPAVVSSGLNDLFELSSGIGMAPGGYVAPKSVWLPAVKAKGLEISGTFSHRQGHIYMEMNFTNKALQHMTDFAIQFNKNSFGVIPSTPLAIHTPLMPNQSIDVSLPLNTLGPVMKMEPLNNLQTLLRICFLPVVAFVACQMALDAPNVEQSMTLESSYQLVAVKNNIDVFYFSCLIPLNVLFVEDGKMERQVFLATWKDIPNENELQFQIKDCHLNAERKRNKPKNPTLKDELMLEASLALVTGRSPRVLTFYLKKVVRTVPEPKEKALQEVAVQDTVSSKLQNNNVYTIAKRNVEGQDMLYQSLKLTNGIWILAELRIQPGNPNYTLSLKCRAPEVSQYIYQAYDAILKN